MKTLKYFSFGIIIFISVFLYHPWAKCSIIPDGIDEAFKKGDAQLLSAYINATIEMSILDKEGVYSNSQATQILNNFFKKNPVKNFALIHKGGKEGNKYAIGKYESNNNKYRITIYIKNNTEKPIIHQLRIQYDNN